MIIKFPESIRRAGDALRFACDRLSENGIDNYIHYEYIVAVEICGDMIYPIIDFSKREVILEKRSEQ